MSNQSENRRPRLLIVDDEESIRILLHSALGDSFDCTLAACSDDVRRELDDGEQFAVILSDIDLKNGDSGNDLIPLMASHLPDTPVVMISGNRDIDNAITAMRAGAFDFIKKPFDLDYLDVVVGRAFEHHRLLIQKRLYENDLEKLVRERTEQLNYLSFYDPLTDLPNRSLFEDRVDQTLSALDVNSKAGLMLISIDGFSKVQQTLGHENSDRMLVEIGKRLRGSVGAGATVSHYERDEFAVLFGEIETADELVTPARQISEAIRRPLILDGHEIFVASSIGISISPENGEDRGTLMRNAAAAMALAKDGNGDAIRFYTSDLNERARRRMQMDTRLRHALDRGEFEVFYQPKVEVCSGSIVGMEALVRWNSSDLGLVPPGEFIQLAEETGLILPLGTWVLGAACRQAAIWRGMGFDLELAVNLSARQLAQNDLADTVLSVLKDSGLAPEHLNLEITESSVIENADPALAALWAIRGQGVKISIDDFGTGYSSLSNLRNLPIDVIKIDRSFVNELPNDADDAALTAAIISLGHALRMTVVAEGVEEKVQLDFLRTLKCEQYQGYLFSPPLASGDFEKLLNRETAGQLRAQV